MLRIHGFSKFTTPFSFFTLSKTPFKTPSFRPFSVKNLQEQMVNVKKLLIEKDDTIATQARQLKESDLRIADYQKELKKQENKLNHIRHIIFSGSKKKGMQNSSEFFSKELTLGSTKTSIEPDDSENKMKLD